MQRSKTSNPYHDGRRKTKLKNDYHGMLSFFSAAVGCGPLRIVNTFRCLRSEEPCARRRGWWENLAPTNAVEEMSAVYHVELSKSNEGSEQATPAGICRLSFYPKSNQTPTPSPWWLARNHRLQHLCSSANSLDFPPLMGEKWASSPNWVPLSPTEIKASRYDPVWYQSG